MRENGTYAAGDEGHLAYTRVSVNVRPDLEALSVTENGTYVPGTNIDGFSQVTVNVAGGGGSGGTGGDSGDGESAGGNTYVVGGNRYVIGQDTNWHYWIGTLDEYMAISTPDPRTVYFILPPDDDMPANETTDEDLDERE